MTNPAMHDVADWTVRRLTPAMRRGVLSAQPTLTDEPEFGDVHDYCPGHESLDGAHMGETVHCAPPARACGQAVRAYQQDRTPDPDVLHIELTDRVRVSTIVGLMRRGICLDGRKGNDHKLTDLGYAVYAYLKTQQGSAQS